MNKIICELQKSIRYIVPIILIFLGIILLQNYNNILEFIKTNVEIISGLITPFIIGFIIAYILNYPMRYIEGKFKLKRGIAVAIVYGALVTILVFIWLYILPVIKSNINDIYSYIPQGIKHLENLITNISSDFKINIDNPNVTMQINEFIKNTLIPFVTASANIISETAISFMGILVTYTVNIFLGIVISVYLLLSKEKTIKIVDDLLESLFGKLYLKVREFLIILDKNIGVYIVAKAIDSTIYGIGCTIMLYIVGSKYALFLGVAIAITNMIPFFGPIIGTIVATVINLFFSFDKALIVLVVLIVAQQVESAVLEPYFVGKQVGVPPIITIFAVTLAGKYTGFFGMMLSVPIASVLIIYINRFVESKKKNKVSLE